ncbi:MAG: helix-turn-helix domain-containing protein [Bacteroidales bacterium]|nr:helix-turn-helix domain-containing protein [Bacteroidales bacterium]
MAKKKHTRFEDLEDKYFGKVGTPEREQYEFDLNMEMIGDKIKQLRLKKHMTQTELGELIGVKRAQISKLENGNHSASISTLMKVFHAMKAKIKFRIESDDSVEFAF